MMIKRSKKMTTEMILLGMMHEKSLTGYEMKKICQEQFMHYTDINLSSIYSTLKRLEKEGLIKGKTVQGERMEKNVFTITDLGKKQFKALIEKHLSDASFHGLEFNAALSFLNHIDKKHLREILEARKKTFLSYLERMHSVGEEKCKANLEKHKILLDRGMMHMKAELSWIKQAIEELR